MAGGEDVMMMIGNFWGKGGEIALLVREGGMLRGGGLTVR